jgi:hypothetical protein
MTDKPNTAEPGKQRRRWFQFSLRTLLLMVTIVGLLCPVGAHYLRERQRRQKAIEREIETISKALEQLPHQGPDYPYPSPRDAAR